MHHHRKRSGNGSANTSYTDVRRAVTASEPSARHKSSRPAPLTRRTTPQVAHKLGKNPRDREREMEDEYRVSEERESFPQYCMTCEKQFLPSDARHLYCSESCRLRDHSHTTPPSVPSTGHAHNHVSHASHASHAVHYPFYSAGNPEPRDIIPRASPSRPSSMAFSPPTTPKEGAGHTSAISALRSLSIRPPSPPSPPGTYQIWPFTRSAANSPTTSYSRPVSTMYSSTYDGFYNVGGHTKTASPSTERPLLPSRRPGAYSRPKSIELVTPMVSR